MDYEANYNDLCSLLLNDKGNIKRVFNQDFSFIPLKTNLNSTFENGFKPIIGNFVRILNNKKWDKNITNERIIGKIMQTENIDYEKQDKSYLNALIKSYLLDYNNEINIIHPYMYMYIPETESQEKSSENNIAQFFYDVMFKDVDGVKDYFDFRDDDKTQLYYKNNILIDLILENLPILKKEDYDSTFYSKLDFVRDVFKEDMEFGFKHEEFLTNHLEELFAYYYFFYLTQFSFQLYSSENNLNKLHELYYLLDDESLTINRKTNKSGYSFFKKKNEDLMTEMYIVGYLNKLLGTKGLFYSEILEQIDLLHDEDLCSFKKQLIKFIYLYNDKRNLNFNYELQESMDHIDLIKYLYDSLNEDFFKPARTRYLKGIEDLAKKFFLKNKGRYGYVLNINSNLLLAITALCIKEEKIKLKQLFKEYERRGLFFDKYTKIQIENLLTKLNLIDKKSDSGDAQYVRRIL